MALSDLQILYNVALGYIGDYEVTESDTSSKQYSLCTRFYEQARDEVLVAHTWNEAIERSAVLQASVAPIHTYSYKYALPADCLRVISIGNDTYDWQVEGDYILTDYIIEPDDWTTGEDYVAGQYVSRNSVTYLCNASHTSATATDPVTDVVTWTTQNADYGYLNLTYIKQLTTISSFSPRLYNAIAMNLAIKIATSIAGGDTKLRMQLLEEYEKLVLPQARSVDSMQGRPKPIYNSEWIRSRQ
jgi:hypothetical protein